MPIRTSKPEKSAITNAQNSNSMQHHQNILKKNLKKIFFFKLAKIASSQITKQAKKGGLQIAVLSGKCVSVKDLEGRW